MSGRRSSTPASSGKRQFLVHLNADLIHRIKILAIERNVSASSLVQEALLTWLASQEKSPKPRDSGDQS